MSKSVKTSRYGGYFNDDNLLYSTTDTFPNTSSQNKLDTFVEYGTIGQPKTKPRTSVRLYQTMPMYPMHHMYQPRYLRYNIPAKPVSKPIKPMKTLPKEKISRLQQIKQWFQRKKATSKPKQTSNSPKLYPVYLPQNNQQLRYNGGGKKLKKKSKNKKDKKSNAKK